MTFFPNSGNIPKLRFSEFTGNWIKYHLKEIAEKANNKNNNNKISTVFSNSAVQGIVLQSDYFDKSIANKENLEGYYVVEPFDFVYNPRLSSTAEVGAMSVNKTNLTGLVSPLYTVFRIKENNINIPFLEYLFKSKVWHNYMRSIANYGARDDRMNVRSDDFYNLPLTIPNFSEQNKISTFLSLIEVRIQTQRKIISQLKSQMSNLKDLIFEQKLRFTDDKENEFPDWQESRLEDICEKQSSNISANKIEDNMGDYPIYGATGILKNIDFYEVENDYISIIKDGAGVGRLLYCEGKSSVLGTLDIIQSKNINLYFIFLLLSRIDFKKYITGSTIPHIYFKDYKKEKFQIPSIEEQEKIANFFKSLDEKINLETELLTQYENQKKYLLQNLFV